MITPHPLSGVTSTRMKLRSGVLIMDRRDHGNGPVLVVGGSSRAKLEGITDAGLEALTAAAHDWIDVPDLSPALQALSSTHPGLFAVEVVGTGGARFVVDSLSGQPFRGLPQVQAPPELSRFAFLQAGDGEMVLESPLAPFRLRVCDPDTLRALTGIVAGRHDRSPIDEDLSRALVALGFAAPQAEGRELEQWEFHDLLFHTRSRAGNSDAPFGGIFPFRGLIEPEPALKEPPTGTVIPLPEPRIETTAIATSSLAEVLAQRRSIRRHGERLLDREILGEFLAATALVRSVHERSDSIPYDWTRRPYPSGGASYELEFYLTITRCADIDPGTYYYDPKQHALILCSADPDFSKQIVDRAHLSTAFEADPDVVISITARFRRVTWKYRGLAYSVILKHVGVVYQTFYLVATALGIGPCALGSGDARTLSDHLGLDYLTESGVGEFILSGID